MLKLENNNNNGDKKSKSSNLSMNQTLDGHGGIESLNIFIF